MSEDCYIYWDGDNVPEDEKYIYFQCTECHKKDEKGKLWKAQYGYGNWSIGCNTCQKVIHQVNKNGKNKTNS